MKKQNEKNIAITIWNVLGISIILAFFIFSMIVGGSAGHGYQDAGRYFVGDHGDYVEVSSTIWTISCVLEVLFWVFILLTPLGAFLIAKIQDRLEQKKKRLE